jgi:hypothetical protein
LRKAASLCLDFLLPFLSKKKGRWGYSPDSYRETSPKPRAENLPADSSAFTWSSGGQVPLRSEIDAYAQCILNLS